MQHNLRMLIHDFQNYRTLPDGRISVWLGSERTTERARGLTVGQHVWLVAPHEFMAEGVIPEPSVTAEGVAYWSAIFDGWDQLIDLPLAEDSDLPFPAGWDGSEALDAADEAEQAEQAEQAEHSAPSAAPTE